MVCFQYSRIYLFSYSLIFIIYFRAYFLASLYVYLPVLCGGGGGTEKFLTKITRTFLRKNNLLVSTHNMKFVLNSHSLSVIIIIITIIIFQLKLSVFILFITWSFLT
jgi:hypothetical protein